MNTNPSIFRDRPLTADTRPTPLYIACGEYADPFDVLLRGLLVICMVGALALVGLETATTVNTSHAPQIACTAPATAHPAIAAPVTRHI